MDSQTPLRILSLDGGGIRGISSLLILENIMETIRETKRLDSVPRPCECFDLIGGTSTGGIIAIMLGRLRMTVDECIRAYRKVAQQAFKPRRTSVLPGRPSGTFSSVALEDAIKQTIREFCVEDECVARRREAHSTIETCPHSDTAFRDRTCIKTVVLAVTKDNVDAPPTLFKTYDVSAALDSCTIWQVARATSAATTFFDSISVGRDAIKFIDAGFGYNNPCWILIEEGQRLFPDHSQMRVLSVGTGLGDTVTIGNSRRSIIKALKQMASSSKKVAASLDHQYGGKGEYYRFNVDNGLQDVTLSDWEKSSRISAHTCNYLAEKRRAIQEFVNNLASTSPPVEEPQGKVSHGLSDEGLDRKMARGSPMLPFIPSHAERQMAGARNEISETPSGCSIPVCHVLPFRRNGRFVGRESTLDTLKEKLFLQKETQKAAIFGLGGVGKTQVTLQLAYWVKDSLKDCSVFWVPALSDESFEQAYTEIARKRAIDKDPHDKSIKESVKRHLSSETSGRWFLVVDNADDKQMLFGAPDGTGGIDQFLPQSESGVTLFTTRSREVAVSAAESDVIELQRMGCQEAKDLFKKSLPQKDLLSDDAATTQLVEKLSYLPLAIRQAAAYINSMRVTITKYLDLLCGAESDMVSLLSRRFPDDMRYKSSQDAVATTWLVSFDQIRKHDKAAADLLSFMSCIEPKAIPQSILPKPETDELMAHAIGILDGYAFVTRRDDDQMFDMHSLVHMATQTWVRNEGLQNEMRENALRHLLLIFPSPLVYENQAIWRSYLPHALRALQESKELDISERSSLNHVVGQSLLEDGRTRESVKCFAECVEWKIHHLSDDDSSRLASQHELASAYIQDGKSQDAIQLLEHVVAMQEALPEENLSRLVFQHTLARAYLHNGQIEKCVQLLEHVVSMEKALPEEDRLIPQQLLARAYLENRQVEKALQLLQQVDMMQRTLPDEYPSRLAGQHTLAEAYLANGQIAKAVQLLEHVVAVKERTLFKNHPYHLLSQHELARAYLADNQIEKAVQLLEHVVTTRERTLSKEHPNLLASQHELARAYIADNQVRKSLRLLEHVITTKERILSEKHPDLLTSQHELARAYLADNQSEKTVRLFEDVVTTRERTLFKNHFYLLESQHVLATAYLADNQIERAVQLFEHVVAVDTQTLPEDDSFRLKSQHELARAYLADGQIERAVQLFEHVVAVKAQTLSEDDPSRLTSQCALAQARKADAENDE